jgi:hypothetical protein
MSSRLFLSFLFYSTPLLAADYYVSPEGDESAAGSKAAPWENIQDSMDRLKPGDTLHVMRGQYREKLYVNNSGTEGKPITLQGEPGAIISGKGVSGENLIYIEDKSHIRIIGLELRDNLKCNDGSGIRVYGSGSHIELRSNKIHEIRGKDAMGITVYGINEEASVSHLIIDGNEIYDCDPAESEALTLNGNVEIFQVTNNHIHDCNNIGIDFIGGEEWATKRPDLVTRNGICKGNRVFRCRATYEGGYGAGIYVDCGINIVIENNIIAECDLGIEVGAENKGCVATGIVVQNNIIFHNEKAGLVFGGYEKKVGRVKDCKFLKNICMENSKHAKDHSGELWIQWAEGNTVSGNTFIAAPGAPLVNVDHGGLNGNTLSGNRYYTALGAAEAFFILDGEELLGFDKWKESSKMDADATFGPIEVKLPAIPPKAN